MGSEELKETGWSSFGSELKAMARRLASFMASDNPQVRSWAIVRFQNAFETRQ